MATKRPSPYLTTTVAFKPTPVRPIAAIKPVAPFVWKTPPLPKPPKPDPATLERMVKIHGSPAVIRARSTGKR